MRLALITIAFVTAITALTGCAGMSYAMKHYSNTPVEKFSYHGKIYRMFDKPSDTRIMITPSIGDSMGQGAVKGLTLMAADTSIPKPVFQEAVEAYLSQKHGECIIVDGYKVIEPQWEFRYSCK
jgi:hypothetical protein